ncbi:hypothetical protein FGO68_gene7888 [Halteria grandinella]|uniref:Uncharacterized protein n=1 Tax=Halteria grandinella TaxID=5974 RepID=A0A8J8P9L2_HALGN|nr:hypothetical protein FGO68_gene7888 [Halteria grandinella]
MKSKFFLSQNLYNKYSYLSSHNANSKLQIGFFKQRSNKSKRFENLFDPYTLGKMKVLKLSIHGSILGGN